MGLLTVLVNVFLCIRWYPISQFTIHQLAQQLALIHLSTRTIGCVVSDVVHPVLAELLLKAST